MERLKERVAHIGQYAVTLLKWMVLGGVIGLVGGIIGSLFHIGVDTATQVRLAHPWVLYLMPVGGLAIVGLYRLTKTEGKGTDVYKRQAVLRTPAALEAAAAGGNDRK